MPGIRTSITINKPVAEVWAALMDNGDDGRGWDWVDGFRAVGKLDGAPGACITAFMHDNGMDEKETYKATVKLDKNVKNQHLGWSMKVVGGYLIQAHHWFELSSISETETKVENCEDLGGCVWFGTCFAVIY
jgi:hypothetical protein